MAIVFVNAEKKQRAEALLALVLGKVVPKDAIQDDQKTKFAGFLAEAKVDPKGPDALEFLYTKLGGLVRTPEEQKKAEAKKAEAQAKARKRKVE